MAFTFVAAVLLLTQQTVFGEVLGCKLTVAAERNGLYGLLGRNGEPPGEATIFGKPVVVPAFQLRFVDDSGQPVVPTEITILYGWRWLIYPYPEHPLGVWNGASDWVGCLELKDKIQVPEFEVRPRGWYDGKYTRFPYPRRPSFTGISVRIELDGAQFGADLSAKDAMKLKGKTAVFHANRQSENKIVIER
jgi:hypothetical protein